MRLLLVGLAVLMVLLSACSDNGAGNVDDCTVVHQGPAKWFTDSEPDDTIVKYSC